jgi:hypothetical protein
MLLSTLRGKPALTGLFLAGVSFLAWTFSVSADPGDTNPTGHGIGTKQNHGDNGNGFGDNGNSHNPPGGNGISYHGGPVLTTGSYVYYIWYGNWSANTATTILPKLPVGLSASPYFNINTTYYNASIVKVKNAVSLVAQYTFPGTTTYGTSLTDASIQAIVASVINGGHLAYDPNGVYFVLTSPEITETSGFCTKYCGWHTHFSLKGLGDVKYAFVGDADSQCPSACEEQTAASPNGNTGADGMASVIAHELEEATTDPDLNAWYDNKGNEDADKCAWTFGTTSKASNGSLYNVVLGGVQFLIQQNWVNAKGGYCAMSY